MAISDLKVCVFYSKQILILGQISQINAQNTQNIKYFKVFVIVSKNRYEKISH